MKKVAIIEDDRFILDIVSQKLIAAEYSVSSCVDGGAAIAHIETVQPDVVLLDLDLPNMHGTDILRALRESEQYKDLPVIIFSNNDTPGNREEMQKLGADGFYFKAATDTPTLLKIIEDATS